MKSSERNPKQSFGRSFENAYMKISDQRLVEELYRRGILDPYGQNNALLSATDNFPELKKMREKIVQSEKLAWIGTLATGITHGINNPLAGIMGYAEIMQGENNLNLMKKYAEKIMREVEKAADIVEWLSRYSRQAKDSNITDVDLNEAIDESLEALKHNRKSCNIEIERNYRKIPEIKGNPIELQQIFVNLVDNALEAMEDGGRLGFSTTINQGYVEVKVSDDGIGISKENMSNVFKPFFSTKETGKSTGLGLYVTSLIVEKHHGTIEIESEIEKGTTFTLKFPISEETT